VPQNSMLSCGYVFDLLPTEEKEVLHNVSHVVSGDEDRVARILQGKPGVATVDTLEGPPDVLVVIAPDRQKAAECLMRILNSVDSMTENLRVLPVHDGTNR